MERKSSQQEKGGKTLQDAVERIAINEALACGYDRVEIRFVNSQ
jgi:hypothetical protein